MQKNNSMLGDLLIKDGLITQEQLDAAIHEQEISGLKLGHILINLNLINSQTLQTYLDKQTSKQKKIRVGDLLVNEGLINQTDLQNALSEQKKSGHKLGQVLINMQLITEEQMLTVLSEHLHIPLINLRHYQYSKDIVKLIPEMIARRFRSIPLAKGEDGILIGMADPTDIFAYDQLSLLLKQPIQLAIVSETEIIQVIDQIYRKTGEITSYAEILGEELADANLDLEQIIHADMAVDAPVVHLLQSLFEDAVQMNASDIHIEPDEKVLRIRQRIDGILHEQIMDEVKIAPALVSRLKLMSGLNISEKRQPQDGRFNIKIQKNNIDVRLSTMPIQFGESVVMRLLNQSTGQLAIDDLGMPDAILQQFKRLLKFPHGMILVTGPTGSGKTTTLYSALSHVNDPHKKIITVEDPVEYRLPRINQVQVNPKINLTFSKVLRTALRQDPDIILIGEIRDAETAEIGLRASITGHLVLSSLHTNSAIATVNRLLDMGSKGYLLASALVGIISQRLIRKVCSGCAKDHNLSEQDKIFISAITNNNEQHYSYKKGHGCNICNHSGYHGRIGVYEFLEIDASMLQAITHEDTHNFAETAKKSNNFHPLHLCALKYAQQGITSIDEVIRIAGDISANDLV